MLSALAAALVEAGVCRSASVTAEPEQDGGAAIRRVAAGGSGVLGSCTPTYHTTPVVHELPQTWQTLTPIAGLVADSYLVVVRTGSFANSAELFSGPSAVAVPKRGGNTDIQAMLLSEATGVDIDVVVEHDPKRLLDLLFDGGAQWTTGVHSDFARELQEGTLDVLASFDTASASPSADEPTLPVPTLHEQGVNVTFPLWRGVIGPGGLADPVVAAWDTALQSALTQPAWHRYTRTHRQRTAYLAHAEFTALLAAEDERYRRWVSALAD